MNGARADGAAVLEPSLRPGMTLPWTTYVFLLLLLISYAVPPILKQVLPAASDHRTSVQEGALTEQDFGNYVGAEGFIRFSYIIAAVEGIASGPNGSGGSSGYILDGERRDLVVAAVDDYRKLSVTTHVANMDRRVLILQHGLGKPVDQTVLNNRLRPDLRIAGLPSQEIDAELRLWRAVYGAQSIPTSAVGDAVRRVRRMDLHFLQDQALADIYKAAGQTGNASAAQARLRANATRFIAVIGVYVVAMCIAFIVGIVLIVVFLTAARERKWQRVNRVATAPLKLGWGDLMDGFVFYIALYRFTSLCAGIVLRNHSADLDPHAMLTLDAAMQIGIGAIAVSYIAVKALRNGTTLADIGLRLNGSLWPEIGYGIAGYCASLPLLLLLGRISQLIFRHNTDVTPNPILPLMVGTHDLLSRTIIFLMVSIAAPFIEETFFRGALFTGLRTRYGWSVSALISAACFALLHPMQDWLPILGLGFTFATMREMRQSLVPGMTAHFLQNTLSFVILTSLFSS